MTATNSAHSDAVADNGSADTLDTDAEAAVNAARKSWQDAGVHKSGIDGYVSLINVLYLQAVNANFNDNANTNDPDGNVDKLSTAF